MEVHLHTTRVADGDQQVQDGIAETLAAIKRLVEERGGRLLTRTQPLVSVT